MRNTYGHAYVPRGIMKIIPFWEYRYPMTFARIGTFGAIFCVALGGAIFCVALGGALGVAGYAWGAALFAAAALRAWIAYQLVQCARS
jgi:hypothetical protein